MQNTEPLVTSDQARRRHGLPLLPHRGPDVLRPQRLAAPVRVYIEAYSAHPLERDAAHLYAHIDGGRIFPITYNVAEVVEGYATLGRLASSHDHVVPGHDPLVLARYPAAKPGLAGWVARLDAEPKA